VQQADRAALRGVGPSERTTFTAWNPMHPARMLKDAGGIPAHQDPRAERDAGCRFDVASPDYR
jgi:hypothetical protein